MPFGTFLVNISGCFFLGWLLTVLAEREPLGIWAWLRSDDLRLLLAVGFTGAYTTFSTFEWESDALLRDGEGLLATVYLVTSVFLGLLAVRAGAMLARGL
jgi:CrcB protein